jgi:hypothetical protein
MKFENIFEKFCDKIEFIIGMKKENKFISIEYFFGIVISFTLWGYHLVQTAIISQEYYHKCMFKIFLYYE